MRNILLSAVLGLASAGAGTYVVHRAVWKSSEEQARRIEKLLPESGGKASPGAADLPRKSKVRPACGTFINHFVRWPAYVTRKSLTIGALSSALGCCKAAAFLRAVGWPVSRKLTCAVCCAPVLV
jgi:hypothetical protein